MWLSVHVDLTRNGRSVKGLDRGNMPFMKVVHINKFYHIVGGLEVHFFALTKLLEEKGHSVVPFSMHHEKNIDSPYKKYFVSKVDTGTVSFNLNGIKTALRMFWSFEASRKLRKLIKNERPDVAIVHGIYHQLSPSVLHTLKKYKIPVIMILHDFKLATPVYNLYCPRCESNGADIFNIKDVLKHRSVKNSLAATSVCALEQWLHRKLNVYAKNVDLFLTPAEAMADVIRTYVPTARVEALPNFIQTDVVDPTVDQKKESPVVLLVGRVENIKGIWTAIESQKYLPKNAEIRIVGGGSELEAVKKYIVTNDIQNITCVGHCTGETLENEIKQSSVVVVPSICFDIQPFAIMEAFLYSKPVVAASIGGIPELIEHGKEGFLFQPGNARELATHVAYILDNPLIQERMGDHGRKRVEQNHTPERYLDQLLSHINDIL